MYFEKISTTSTPSASRTCAGRERRMRAGRRRRGCAAAARRVRWYQRPTLPEHHDREQRRDREPGDARLAARQHDERGEQRPERRAGVAADLEQRLREAVPPARGHARHARRLRVEDRRAEPDRAPAATSRRGIAPRHREAEQADEGEPHADRQRVRLRVVVGVEPDHRLQQRRGELEGEGDQADLGEVEREARP